MDNKPSRNEDEYFAKLDAELIKEQRAKLDEERAAQARTVNLMKCPKCGADLREESYHHVKIDVCPDCKGVWLDYGELDMVTKIDDNSVSGFLRGLFKGRSDK